MTLKEDVKLLFNSLLGAMVAEQIENFDDPEKYPKDFLAECTNFLAMFIGEVPAKKKMEPLYRKHLK